MKILYICSAQYPDYQCDMLFHGLKSLFGNDVHETSSYRYMYEGLSRDEKAALYGKGFSLYGLLPLAYKNHPDKEVIESNIKNRYYELIIFGSVIRCMDYWPLVKKNYRSSEIAFVDGEDETKIRKSLVSKGIYFKRELETDMNRVYPICFAIPKEKILKGIYPKDKVVAHIIPGDLKTYIFSTEEAYYEDYRRSLYALTKKKAGWDCLRHYEILANGCIPYFTDLAGCPPRTLFRFPKHIIEKTNAIIDANKTDCESLSDIMTDLLSWTASKLSTESVAMYLIETMTALRAEQIRISPFGKQTFFQRLSSFLNEKYKDKYARHK